MKLLVGLCCTGLLLLATACGGDSAARPAPTSTPAAATNTPVPELDTATPAPTATGTPTPAPTLTATATPEPPTPTPEPPTSTPVPPTATQPPPAPTAPPSAGAGGGGSQSLSLTALNLAFSPQTLVAAPGRSATIVLSNQDNIVPHNVSVGGIGTSATCQGPCTVTLAFTAPAPGSYAFTCTLHPFMTGTLLVQ